MNEEPLVLPGTCGLFLGTGGAGPRALRFSAVPGKGAHVHAYNLLHVYTKLLAMYRIRIETEK